MTMAPATTRNSRVYRDKLAKVLLDEPMLFLSHHDGDPGEGGAGEIVGGSYARQGIMLVRTAVGTLANSDPVEFNFLPKSQVNFFGLWTARTGGEYLTGGPLSRGIVVEEGQSIRWRETELVIRLG